mmetsp:Transcript_4610/g.12952  ORF Transcript_4610/g.12952 Transcript_4610/m.12952 type:complete len:559 (-) Transcript_4610:144-1820(-)
MAGTDHIELASHSRTKSIFRVAPCLIRAGLAVLFCGWFALTFHVIPSWLERYGLASSTVAMVPQITTRAQVGPLSCREFGGPPDDNAREEMVYWSDIPSDVNPSYLSPRFRSHGRVFDHGDKFMTAEFGGGWNNIRMGLETSILLAQGLGRTLVLPPVRGVYLMEDGANEQNTQFSLNDFFHLLDRIVNKQGKNAHIISMSDFLTEVAMKGMVKNKRTQKVEFPPGNRTNWDGSDDLQGDLWRYLRRCGVSRPEWKPKEAIFVIPSGNTTADDAVEDLSAVFVARSRKQRTTPRNSRRFPLDAPPETRIIELLGRNVQRIVGSNAQMDEALLVHFTDVFANFYSYIFYQNWRQDLWSKRFVRDQLRYRDELQCAAARVIGAVRKMAIDENPGRNPYGTFDSFHVRRGDFAVRSTRVSARTLYENSKDELTKDQIIYVATDERNEVFLSEMKAHFENRLVFLEDFIDLLGDMNTNFYNVIDQLVCSAGNVFFGTWASTFTAYIIRLRGYRSENDQGKGLASYFFAPIEKKYEMQGYSYINSYWMREFPAAWQNIDAGQV